ncbi:MAG: VWA domain-containing protein [Cyanobacteria bacterium]|nr:VWA domain-containing protein [Cyanobacteriota bacterium]MDW8202694.1 VWA domain-containing protein [Cyanobacteriota bacterium SKYGB_h_bin112]
MDVALRVQLSDRAIDATRTESQRQVALSVSALPTGRQRSIPLNLCLILDHSGSMGGKALQTVKQAAQQLVDQLAPTDYLSVIAFDHRAKVLVPNQPVTNPAGIKALIDSLQADGGTAIDEGLRLGIEELAKGKYDAISQALLLTDGENEHGDNNRCLKLAEVAATYNLTISTLGFGDYWNQDILERIADAAGGSLAYIQHPESAVEQFNRLFRRMQSVGLTNAYLHVSLASGVRLAELKPIAQVMPEVVELPVQQDPKGYTVRLGDLMIDVPRLVMVNVYISQLPLGEYPIAWAQVTYDDPISKQTGLLSERVPVVVDVVQSYQPDLDPEVQTHILALAKYRQTQLAETKLREGDRQAAATMLQTAAKTALQLGDKSAATVLQANATRLQAGEDLSESDRKKTRLVSKTVLQDN